MQLTFGSDDAFNALLYGDKNPDTVNFFRDKLASIPDTITDAGRTFMNRTREAFEHFNGSSAMRFARGILGSIHNSIKPDVIRPLTDVSELRAATLLMQRWIMANPQINSKYLLQRVDGYSDTYTNANGTDVGEDNYDYRRVKQGWVDFDVEGEDFRAVNYCEDLKPGDRELDITEQSDIHHTWGVMEILLALGKDDFTNTSGGNL